MRAFDSRKRGSLPPEALWWKHKAEGIYEQISDFGGFVKKKDPGEVLVRQAMAERPLRPRM